MRDATNTLLRDARNLSSDIESLNDIDAHLVEHAECDALLVQALRASRYLEVWRDEFERSSWQYDIALIDEYDVSTERKQRYCEEVMEDEALCQNRFVLNHAGYVSLNALHPRQYFALKVELYDVLTEMNARRIKAATAWLERRGVLTPVPSVPLRPHTPEWFASLREWNPKQAAMTEATIQATGSSQVCSVCGDDPACDYALVNTPAAGPGTLRLCDDCFRMRSVAESMRPF